MEKINVAELLRNCPSGMKLDCTLVENLYFDCINDSELDDPYPIQCYTQNGLYRTSIRFNEYGHYTFFDNSKCVIFPEGKTTWEGFVPPLKFKDGDVIYNRGIKATAIFYKQTDDSAVSHCFLNILGNFRICHYHSKDLSGWEFATEEEKQKLFQAIKDNGYRWNAETKTLEKLIEPQFKVGDRIVKKNSVCVPILITKISDEFYYSNTESSVGVLSISEQDEYELVPNKFDITTLKPFDKVLVRMDDKHVWSIQFFERLNTILKDSFVCMGGGRYHQCIPYEGNEHLLNKVVDCDEFYRTWKKTGD